MNCWEYISNDRTDFVCLSSNCTVLIRKRPQVIPGWGGCAPLHPPGSAPDNDDDYSGGGGGGCDDDDDDKDNNDDNDKDNDAGI